MKHNPPRPSFGVSSVPVFSYSKYPHRSAHPSPPFSLAQPHLVHPSPVQSIPVSSRHPRPAPGPRTAQTPTSTHTDDGPRPDDARSDVCLQPPARRLRRAQCRPSVGSDARSAAPLSAVVDERRVAARCATARHTPPTRRRGSLLLRVSRVTVPHRPTDSPSTSNIDPHASPTQ